MSAPEDTPQPEAEGAHSLHRMVRALELIAAKSGCRCWDVPGMGSGLPYVWRGCREHHSDDPKEWCLTCIANEALKMRPNIVLADTKSVLRDNEKPI